MEDSTDYNEIEIIAKPIPYAHQGEPVFHNECVKKLFFAADKAPTDELINEILDCERSSIITDLTTVIYDGILHTDYYREIYKTLPNDSLIHAYFLLGELKAEEALEAVINCLCQNENTLDFWFGDLLTEDAWQVILFCGYKRLDVLQKFIVQPNTYLYSKTAVSQAVAQGVMYDYINKDAAVIWFNDAFEWFLNNQNDIAVLDTELIASMIADCLDFKAVELLPIMKQMYDNEIVSYGMCGSYHDVEKAFEKEKNREFRKYKLYSIAEFYDSLNGWYYKSAKETPEEFKKRNKENNNLGTFTKATYAPTINTEPKLQRNDPCHCGSGKKFKKCCG